MNDPRGELIVRDDVLPAGSPELRQLFFTHNTPIDISYLDTQAGDQHLRIINKELQKKSIRIQIEKDGSNATLSINLCAPSENANGCTLLPLFSLSRPLATNDHPGEKFLPDHLNKLGRAARVMGNEPKITKPIIKEYLRKMPFGPKMAAAWSDEIRPTIAAQLAQHIGRELTKAILIKIGMTEITPTIICDGNKQLSDSIQLLNSQEAVAEKLIFLKKYQDLRSPSAKQDELFIKTYEQLITV